MEAVKRRAKVMPNAGRTNIINCLAQRCGAEHYLEIGIRSGVNYRRIIVDNKVGVDPRPRCGGGVIHSMTSDKFFKINTQKFDLIFVDGDHSAGQVYKDITNSLVILNHGGYIVCHDMNPIHESWQRVPQPRPHAQWNGDGWKAWVKLRSQRLDLCMFVVNRDEGCGVITWGHQKLINAQGAELNWNNLRENRQEWLNLITYTEFWELYGS